ncbi:MAG: sigma-54-dependent Fis family transcriptional regulator [Pyrinomonadaceae bacterium]|nr:sigma-54-dependent Fis family transcriptional regulator [Pyrinomonadaceae bacterium]MDQ3173811.1 sigma-54 dependent transcriptional regulator [Acidobacteriota bacterium]
MNTTATVAFKEEKRVENKNVRILVVDDEPMMADSLKQNLMEEGFSVDTAATGAEAIELFDQGGHHLAICDLQLPDMDGLEVMRHMKDARPTTEVIVVTGYGSVARAVEATKAGAFYFVEKPFDFDQIQPLVDKALERRELVAETTSMRRQLSTRSEYFNIIGSAKPMQAIYETIESVAKSDANVLIVGESGTGKELIANAIHYNSLRSKKAFIKVNCAALPKELIESELFGHTKGAFTGAHADKEGLVQHAARGSLMLDEIAEMPVELQPKLLRVLQERSYRKIGSEKTYAVDFRLISSTNRLPADAIRDGLLRDDLFYRISTITIHVPPLRERNEDIQLLTEHFLHMYAQKYERAIGGVSQAAYQRLFGHLWPGNVRELQNVIERAVLLAKGNRIEPLDLPFDNGSLPETGSAGPGWDVPPNMTLEDIERLVIERTLQRTGGNKQAAANLLGIYRPRLYSKIRKYNIDVTALVSA